MSNDRITVKKLSSAVLDMKFMLRTKKKLEAKEKKKKSIQLQNSFPDPVEESTSSQSEEKSAESRFEICTDLTKLEDLHFGRMSFKGYNKEVEDLMNYYERLKNGELSDDEEDEKDVKDIEMAETLRGTGPLAKKFMSKRERQQQDMKNDESASGNRLNFKNVRKRGSDQIVQDDSPKRKFLKPAD